MSNLIAVPAIPEQRQHAPAKHPVWCDPRLCREDSVNVAHQSRTERWLATDSDTQITIGLAQTDEFAFDNHEQLAYAPAVRLHFEDTESIHVAYRAGQRFEIAAEAHLDATDCRKLAAQLLELAQRLDGVGGAE